ncbi:MAG: polysaccharide pyruvyl transferase family protein [Myxococcota bacterium]|nr:polysaccharide pyruvyl transferase family protein [Myxococcota bacterium]
MHPALKTLQKAIDPDRVLMNSMGALIESNGIRHALNKGVEKWEPGKPLKLILAGYVGTRNTGADVRVEEMIRQFRHVIGDDNLELAIMTMDPKLTAGYFRTVKQVQMPVVFPKFLFDEVPKYHGVIACEGSMFKSKFSSALTCFMAGALGMAAAENKVSVGYGAEAGDMTKGLQSFVEKYCRHSLVICRNEPSRGVLGQLGIRTTSGADTAWTFDPGSLEVGRKLLEDAGWDGKKKVLAVCPINPFWWPVKPDLMKAAARTFLGEYKTEHYRSVYFHNKTEENDRKYDAYIEGIAEAMETFQSERDVFPILVGMEKLDRRSAEAVKDKLSFDVPLFVSDEHDMYQMVSVLRSCQMLVSSRFHAIVTSMPGLVPSAGITMDERIRNLMNDRNDPDLFLEVDEDDLAEKILRIFHRLYDDGESIAEGIGRAIPRQLQLMGNMGIDFMDEVVKTYPEFPRKDLPRTWEAHLPPLPKVVSDILESYA